MSDLGFNIWGVVAGVIGTVALVPVFLAWLRTRVPTKRFPALRDLLKETQDLFKTVVQEGLITDEDELREIDCNMALLTVRADELRAEVYDINCRSEDVSGWWHGLSDKIIILRGELNALRKKLARRCSIGRRDLVSAGTASGLTFSTSRDVPHPTLQHIPSQAQQSGVPASQFPHVVDGESTVNEKRHIASLSASAGDRPTSHILPTHHVISRTDLQDLLSLALTRPRSTSIEMNKVRRASRQRVLLNFGRQLYGVDAASGLDSHVNRHAKRRTFPARLKALSHILRRTRGSTPHNTRATILGAPS